MRITLHARSALPLLFILTLVPGTAFAQDAEIDSVRAFLVETFDAPTWIDDSTWNVEKYRSYFLADRTSIVPLPIPELESLLPHLRFYRTTIHGVCNDTICTRDLRVIAYDTGAGFMLCHTEWRSWVTLFEDVLMRRSYEAEEREQLIRGISRFAKPEMQFDVRSEGRTVKAIQILPDTVKRAMPDTEKRARPYTVLEPAEGSVDSTSVDFLFGNMFDDASNVPFHYTFEARFDSDGHLLSIKPLYNGRSHENGNYRPGFWYTGWNVAVPDVADTVQVDSFLRANYKGLNGYDTTIASQRYRLNDYRKRFKADPPPPIQRVPIYRLLLGALDTLDPEVRFFGTTLAYPLVSHGPTHTRLWMARGYDADTGVWFVSTPFHNVKWNVSLDLHFFVDAFHGVRFDEETERQIVIGTFIDGKRPYPYGRLTYHEENGCTTATLEAARRIWKMRVCFDEEGRLTEIDEDASRWYREDEY